jgi:hypothetical protein
MRSVVTMRHAIAEVEDVADLPAARAAVQGSTSG